MEVLKAAAAAGVVLIVLDGLWLGVFARKWTQEQFGPLMRDSILWPPAVAFYLLYAVGVGVFVVELAGGDWVSALWRGALFGLVAYGTYDLTNWSTLKNWPRAFSVVDMVWGSLVTAASGAGGVLILNAL